MCDDVFGQAFDGLADDIFITTVYNGGDVIGIHHAIICYDSDAAALQFVLYFFYL